MPDEELRLGDDDGWFFSPVFYFCLFPTLSGSVVKWIF